MHDVLFVSSTLWRCWLQGDGAPAYRFPLPICAAAAHLGSAQPSRAQVVLPALSLSYTERRYVWGQILLSVCQVQPHPVVHRAPVEMGTLSWAAYLSSSSSDGCSILARSMLRGSAMGLINLLVIFLRCLFV